VGNCSGDPDESGQTVPVVARRWGTVAAVYDRRFFLLPKPALIERRYSTRYAVARSHGKLFLPWVLL